MEFWSKYTRRSNIAALMLLWLFVGYIGCISLFMHRHTIDGQTIYHSHFYSGTTDSPSHSHTAQQFKVITALSLYVALTATTATMVVAPRLKVSMEVKCATKSIIQLSQQIRSLRAPPVFI